MSSSYFEDNVSRTKALKAVQVKIFAKKSNLVNDQNTRVITIQRKLTGFNCCCSLLVKMWV